MGTVHRHAAGPDNSRRQRHRRASFSSLAMLDRPPLGKLKIFLGYAAGVGKTYQMLEEAQEASLILHVTDVSNPNHASQDAEVVKVLTDLGIEDRPRLHILNKVDMLSKEDLAALRKANSKKSGKVLVSATEPSGRRAVTVSVWGPWRSTSLTR